MGRAGASLQIPGGRAFWENRGQEEILKQQELELGEQCEEGMRRDQTGGWALWAALGHLG